MTLKGFYTFNKQEIDAVKIALKLYLSLNANRFKNETNEIRLILDHNYNNSSLKRYSLLNPMGAFKVHSGQKIKLSDCVEFYNSKNI